MSQVKYRIVRDQVLDDRPYTGRKFLLLAQVYLPGTGWQDFTHPRRGGPTYDPGAEHMIHRDVRAVYPDAQEETDTPSQV